MTPDQLRLLAELAPYQILGLADDPGYWCGDIRDGKGGGTAKDSQWREARLHRATYRWGVAMTTEGDYFRERSARALEHAARLTWGEIMSWVGTLPAEVRADARRARRADETEQQSVIARILAPAGPVAVVEEMTLW